jgi:hypothetical protein
MAAMTRDDITAMTRNTESAISQIVIASTVVTMDAIIAAATTAPRASSLAPLQAAYLETSSRQVIQKHSDQFSALAAVPWLDAPLADVTRVADNDQAADRF